jgi:hypothetical protein
MKAMKPLMRARIAVPGEFRMPCDCNLEIVWSEKSTLSKKVNNPP